MTTLRIALAQIDTCVGDVDGNAAAVLSWARRAADAGAHLVVFPEMTLTGYPIEDLALRASFRRGAEAALQRTAAELAAAGLGDLAVLVGTVGERGQGDVDAPDDRGLPTNQAVLLQHGRVVTRYDKHHLPNYGVFDEFRIFAPGDATCVVDVAGRRVGVVVCEDIWQDGGPVAQMDENDVDLLVVLNGSPYEEGKGHVRVELAQRRAREVDAPVAYVNLVGGQDDLVFDGGSFVVGTDGELLAGAPQFVEHLLLWDLAERGTAPVRGAVAAPLAPDEEVYRAIVTGLAGYVRKNGFRSVVLGLSGGIDSALTAAIAADAIGGENVVGVSMPSSFSSAHSKDDAADLAKRLGADLRVQPIASVVDAFQAQLALEGVAEENLQARVRGVLLMAVSNREGHLVIAPGNKSELATGYATIYDAGSIGGFAPLKDVDKSRVWALARWRNAYAEARGEVPPIPESSITKPPSAELRPGQLDQDSLPPYDLLDEVLDAYVEHAEGRAELLARGFDPAVVDKVVTLVDRAEWKRRQYPLGPKVTALAFGRDRRLPVTSRWREP
ncbi:NAD+ synthase [Cellulomonas fimi]|uniref:Glutamine-dependent NAD(+) synthetase n=1 Tax=Cellulomonas fimi (strain ATCC 484 / DSM 20113 / JCM 1341 / CCUG 24087 / LMG 16345 / NBRC 15513 / NCIMB 8980 / NCTC 7547 / NRS-133) TaxID=590998 RepID=F4H270_CELFA|nr:NAD+ synthase [Cellulomonas fimi]AEE46367.1 NAD+ synthetase [Cellulomonas fimi ATCC 484]NNH07167.1 NAD+ synthase [Cellulomonas fimi]VEH32708.1 Glutamine-dependent NAD(+) synthetase [Cellulomonas fimi]